MHHHTMSSITVILISTQINHFYSEYYGVQTQWSELNYYLDDYREKSFKSLDYIILYTLIYENIKEYPNKVIVFICDKCVAKI